MVNKVDKVNKVDRRMTKNISYVLTIAIACTALSVTQVAHAAAYRWVDNDGVVNFSEHMPRDIAADRVTTVDGRNSAHTNRALANRRIASQTSAFQQSTLASPQTDQQDDESEPELSPEQQSMLEDLEREEAQRQEQIALARRDNCTQARNALNNLTSRTRIRVEGDDGTQRALPEEERQDLIAAAQRGIVTNC